MLTTETFYYKLSDYLSCGPDLLGNSDSEEFSEYQKIAVKKLLNITYFI